MLPIRQVHLDFHTSERMPRVGGEFSEENFEYALKTGHINSITLFSKCHHGWSYHPTNVNAMHPTLNTDLLGRQLAVCQKLGVRTQIYVSAGLDERKANVYPQFRAEQLDTVNSLLGAHWHHLCLNNDDYLAMLIAEVREVLDRFAGQFDGLFLDICWPTLCVCPHCIESMVNLGLDPENREDVEKHVKIVYERYTTMINQVVTEYDPKLPVIYNIGTLRRDGRSVGQSNTVHLELESLPTGGWGYDHFPMSAAYARVWGKEFSGMTGKFHRSWGEFGGYKHPNALIYETALSAANGAACCVGDQLHPLGRFEPATYKLIGKAYEKIEAIEPWCQGAKYIADVALYSHYGDTLDDAALVGANRMMLEGKYLYNIIDSLCNFSDYAVVIFPDDVPFDTSLTQKTREYLAKGGKILLSGKSGLTEAKEFFADFGVQYRGENPIDSTFFIPAYDMKENGIAPYLMNARSYQIEASADCQVKAYRQDSYFNRAFRRFCSHSITPNDPDSQVVAGVLCDNVGYFAWDIFKEYAQIGPFHCKQAICDMLDELLSDRKTLSTDLQSNGIATLLEQKEENRLVNHLLYAVTKLRGAVEVIEDAPTVYHTQVQIRMDQPPKAVYTVPDRKPVEFRYENGVLSYTVAAFTMHGMVVIEKA